MKTKRLFYIVSFAFLGILLQLLAHALIEIWYIGLLLADFPKYGFGLSWDVWLNIHAVLTVLFFAAGAWIGYKEGVYWWRKIYEENAIALWREKWKDKKIPTIWLIVLFLILLAGSACWYYVDDIKPNLNKNKETPIYVEDIEWMREQAAKRLEAETAGWQTYRNEKYGFEFKYPSAFSRSDRGEANGFLIALYGGSKALSDPNTLNSITVFAFSANGEASFDDYLMKYPITDPNNEKPIQFQTRTLGLNVFYYARTERFEGVLSFDYYILNGNTIYRFVSVSRGVDWTNPNLDEENDPTHATLKQILSTFKFLK